MSWNRKQSEIENNKWIIESIESEDKERILSITTGRRNNKRVFLVSETLDVNKQPNQRDYYTFYISDKKHVAYLILEMSKNNEKVPTNVKTNTENIAGNIY